MISPALALRIEEMAQPIATNLGFEFVDIHIHPTAQGISIQILADKPSGGISLDECATLNRSLGQALEEQNFIGQHYILEVSSPGLDRAFKKKRDFERVVGRELIIFLLEPVEGRIEYQGQLKSVIGESIVIDFKAKDVFIPLEKINKAKQII